MRIRNVLLAAFLVATLVPSAIFGWWSYSQGIKREFSEVNDRHLLIAENIGVALKRYHMDVVTTFETVAHSVLGGNDQPEFANLMKNMHLFCVVIVDEETGKIAHSSNHTGFHTGDKLTTAEIQMVRKTAREDKSIFSPVTSVDGKNIMYLSRKYGNKIAVAYLATDYFVELGEAVSFGEKGHAAIVDHEGNILAHPLPDWVAARKNISKVSAVQRMMNGETGIEQFYSPALKSDMIAGLTTVKGPGWGIMVPQPVAEIHAKVTDNNISLLGAIGIGLVITLISVLALVNSLAKPIEKLALALKSNTQGQELKKTEDTTGLIPVCELRAFRRSFNRMVVREKIANKKILSLAYSDSVTGLPNREKFKLQVGEALDACTGDCPGGVLIFVDLDNFKEINDIHGHEVGDDFLRACAAKLQKVSDASGALDNSPAPTVARIGGDEFTILVPGLVDHEAVDLFLDQLRMELASPSDDMGFISNCSASIGCSQYPVDGNHVDDLIRHADVAMYQAKKKGKNAAERYTMNVGKQTAAEIRRDVIIAVDENQFTLEYQPKICAITNRAVGVEALIRWTHPEFGLMMPNEWLPAINNSSAIANLGTWVVNRAMKDHSKFAAAGHELAVSVNIGSKHFISTGFMECLEAAAKRNDFERSMLEIEITEDAIFESESKAEIVLNSLHTLGYTISIDDFGKGYSNIVRFAQLPVDVIKIDRSIVANAGTDPRIKTILESTISMAHDLNSKIVAEGIESLSQAEFVTELGADMLQGHYFATSMSLNDTIKWIDAQNTNKVHEFQGSLQQLTG